MEAGRGAKSSACLRESLWKKRERRLNGARALKKSDLLKIKSVAELRKQTAMSMAWIAKELIVGPNTIWNEMRRLKKGNVGGKENAM